MYTLKNINKTPKVKIQHRPISLLNSQKKQTNPSKSKLFP